MAAFDISVRDTLILLDGPFEPFAAGVSNGLYAFWLGSGISFGRFRVHQPEHCSNSVVGTDTDIAVISSQTESSGGRSSFGTTHTATRSGYPKIGSASGCGTDSLVLMLSMPLSKLFSCRSPTAWNNFYTEHLKEFIITRMVNQSCRHGINLNAGALIQRHGIPHVHLSAHVNNAVNVW